MDFLETMAFCEQLQPGFNRNLQNTLLKAAIKVLNYQKMPKRSRNYFGNKMYERLKII